MNKEQIIGKLTELGIEHNPGDNKATLTTLLPDDVDAAKPAMGRYVATRDLSEDGVHYKPGDELELSAKRASALGKLVRKASE